MLAAKPAQCPTVITVERMIARLAVLGSLDRNDGLVEVNLRPWYSTNSLALSPWRYANRIMVASRKPHRPSLAPTGNRSISLGNKRVLGMVIPSIDMLHVNQGDVLYLVAAPDGYRITPYDPEFERQMEVARRVMKEDRDLLRALAKQ
jgi:hypothetical protein